MGYDVHITHRSDWPLNGEEITINEWLAIVAADPELRLDGYAQAPLPDGKVLRVDDPTLAVWAGWPGHVEGEKMAPFYLADGNVSSKNPDDEVRRKMWRIAQQLNARVQGDDGEFYDEFGDGADGEPEPMRPGETSKHALETYQQPSGCNWLTRLLTSLRRPIRR
jgi:hypothetical protein